MKLSSSTSNPGSAKLSKPLNWDHELAFEEGSLGRRPKQVEKYPRRKTSSRRSSTPTIFARRTQQVR